MNDAAPQTDTAPVPDQSALWGDLRDMLELRRQLAEAEIRSDVVSTKRFTIVGGAGIVIALTALPLLVGVVTSRIDAACEFSFPWTTVGVAGLLLLLGSFVGWSAWRRFRYEFLGLRESRQELQEDLRWLCDRFDRVT